MIRCLILDDEEMSRLFLERFCSKIDDMKVVGSFANPMDAKIFLEQNEVDLMFLDIHMPQLTGMELISQLKRLPKIIVTTTDPSFALDAYEYSVTDYLVKPIVFPRFLKAMDKFREQQNSAPVVSNNLNATPSNASGYNAGFGYRSPMANVQPKAPTVVNTDEQIVRGLNSHEIYYVENTSGFSVFHTRTGKTSVKLSLSEISAILPSDRFVMTHPSYLINAMSIEGVAEQSVLVNGVEIPVNPDRKRILVEVLNRI